MRVELSFASIKDSCLCLCGVYAVRHLCLCPCARSNVAASRSGHSEAAIEGFKTAISFGGQAMCVCVHVCGCGS